MSTPPPTVSSVAEHWYRELAITQPGDEDRGWPLLRVLGACGAAFGRLHDVVRDTDEGLGWTMLLDPARCPGWALPWLAQFAGVKLVTGSTEAQQRAQITAPSAFNRGTVKGMKAAVAATLTSGDPANVQLIERAGGDPYAITVRVRAADCPDTAASTAAALSQKPLGLLLTFVASNSPLIDEATRLGNSATAVGDAAVLGDVT